MDNVFWALVVSAACAWFCYFVAAWCVPFFTIAMKLSTVGKANWMMGAA